MPEFFIKEWKTVEFFSGLAEGGTTFLASLNTTGGVKSKAEAVANYSHLLVQSWLTVRNSKE